jgi:hypothetical protein
MQYNAPATWSTTTPTADGWLKGDGNFASNTGYADGRADLLATQQGTGYDPNQPTNNVGVKFGSAINPAMGVVLPVAGYREDRGGLYRVGRDGYYWKATTSFFVYHASALYFIESSINNYEMFRSDAFPIRCIRKEVGEL